MADIQKRTLIAGAAAAISGMATMIAKPAGAAPEPRAQLRRTHFPNVPLVTQSGRQVRFYDDILKNRKVVINLMYTVCSNICTPVTRNLLEARRLLGAFANDIDFCSITLTPLDDDPSALRAYMKAYGIEGRWTFLTGEPGNIELVRRGLGFTSTRAAEDADLSNHSGMLRIGNERMASWGHASALTNARAIARMIRFELFEPLSS